MMGGAYVRKKKMKLIKPLLKRTFPFFEQKQQKGENT